MTTTTTTDIATEGPAGEPATAAPAHRLPSLLARTALIALMCLGAFAGLGVAKSEPASAATTVNVSVCMKQSSGIVYGNSPVILYRWDQTYGRWYAYKNGATAANGCAVWKNLLPDSYYFTGVNWTYQVGPALYKWSGTTPNWVKVGFGGTYDNGLGTATRTRLY